MKGLHDLADRILLGEDSRLELKAVRMAGTRVRGPARDDLANELVAMANAHGGTLVLGVDDATREVEGIGLEDLDAVEKLVLEACHDSISPPLYPDVRRIRLPAPDGQEKPVIAVDVDRSLYVHQGPGGFWHRVGSSKRQMTLEYLQRLTMQRTQGRLIRFDELPVPRSEMTDLDPALVARFRSTLVDEPDRVLLPKLAMAAEDEAGTLRPSLAGLLLAGRDPQAFLPHAFIQAVAYRGTEISAGPGYQLDAADLGGTLDQQVMDALRFIDRNMRVSASKGVGREDTPQFDLGAAFEALVNAVAHRDYAISGSKVRLRIFEDRLELFSPGGLTNTMTLESMPLRQSARYEAITSLLARVPVPGERVPGHFETRRSTFMDRRGEGVRVVMERGGGRDGRPPRYDLIGDAELRLTLWGQDAGGGGGAA